MDLARRGLLIHDASSPPPPGGFPPPSISSYHPPRVPDPSFPIIAVALIGILAIAFLLVSYYVFVIKCCLNWLQVDVINRFSISRQNHRDDPLLVNSPPRVRARGLDEAAIRSIPVRSFKSRGVGGGGNGKTGEFSETSFCECAVCLNEFQEDEKLKIIPSCCHMFHVDCIDVWLQNNANCPLCRMSISSTILFPVNTTLTPRPSPEEPIQRPDTMTGDEDFVVIELGGGNHEGPFSPESSFCSISITPRDSPFGSEQKRESPPTRKGTRRMNLRKMTSMGDEFIDARGGGKDEFSIQPMRRSISMDSSADRTLLLAVQEALKRQKREIHEVEGCCSCSSSSNSDSNSNSKMWRSRSFFSFAHHGRVPRSAVQPICSEP